MFYGWKPGDHRRPPTRSLDTVLEFPRPRASRDHPTSKPVDLAVHCVQHSSARGELILDPFVGSGTSILAAQATGRRAAALDVGPRFCDVVVRRWEEATGHTATLDGDDRTLAEVATERRPS